MSAAAAPIEVSMKLSACRCEVNSASTLPRKSSSAPLIQKCVQLALLAIQRLVKDLFNRLEPHRRHGFISVTQRCAVRYKATLGQRPNHAELLPMRFSTLRQFRPG